MKMRNIKYAIEILQTEVAEATDLEEVAFFEGAFDVFAKQESLGVLNIGMLMEYLTDFLREDGIERETLSSVKPSLLQELDEMLERLGLK